MALPTLVESQKAMPFDIAAKLKRHAYGFRSV